MTGGRRADDVSLREYVEQAINAERALRAADVDRIETVLALRENEKALQAREYERRLEALNHEQARIQIRDAEFVRNGVHDAEIRRLDDKIVGNTDHVVEVERAVTVMEVRLAQVTSSLLWMTRLLVGAVLTGVVAAGIAIVTKGGP